MQRGTGAGWWSVVPQAPMAAARAQERTRQSNPSKGARDCRDRLLLALPGHTPSKLYFWFEAQQEACTLDLDGLTLSFLLSSLPLTSIVVVSSLTVLSPGRFMKHLYVYEETRSVSFPRLSLT